MDLAEIAQEIEVLTARLNLMTQRAGPLEAVVDLRRQDVDQARQRLNTSQRLEERFRRIAERRLGCLHRQEAERQTRRFRERLARDNENLETARQQLRDAIVAVQAEYFVIDELRATLDRLNRELARHRVDLF